MQRQERRAEPGDVAVERWQKFAGTLASLELAGCIVLSPAALSLAQRPTEEQILNALNTPASKTRWLTTEQSRQNAEDQRLPGAQHFIVAA